MGMVLIKMGVARKNFARNLIIEPPLWNPISATDFIYPTSEVPSFQQSIKSDFFGTFSSFQGEVPGDKAA